MIDNTKHTWDALRSSDLDGLMKAIEREEENGFTVHTDSFNVAVIKRTENRGDGMVPIPIEIQETVYTILLSKPRE